MNLLDLVVKVRADDQATSQVSGISAGLIAKGNVMADAFTMVAGKIADVAGMAVDLGRQAFDLYGEYEQLAGGIETLFGDSAAEAMEKAQQAYKTAGLSANDYMQQVTGFAASLRQALGPENQAQLADYADQAVQDMADNANKMGTDMTSIQYAYQGFAKQNYTMLDNLKLGYGGTKAEMERLMRDAEKLKGMEVGSLKIENFADVVTAVHAIQEEMGITGTTAKEAATTIQGSMAMAKSAWTNFLTELGKDDADIGARIDELMTSIFGDGTEENPGALGNIAPRVVTIVERIMRAIPEIIEKTKPYIDEVAEKIGEFLEEHGPELQAAAEVMFNALSAAIGVAFSAAMQALGNALATLVMTFPEWFPQLLLAVINFLGAIIEGIDQMLTPIVAAMGDLFWGAIEVVKGFVNDMYNAGVNMVQGLIDGIASGASAVIDTIINTVTGAIEAAKRALGINSPSKVFAEIGGNTMLGLARGIDAESGAAYSSAVNAVNSISGLSPEIGASVIGSGNLIQPTAKRDMTVILELDRTQLARAVYSLNNDETQRVGLKLAGGYA